MWSTLDPGARVPLDTSLDFLLLKQTAQINWRGKAGRQVDLRWLKTVLQAVSGNARDGACFKLDKQTWRRKSNGTQKTISQNLLIKIFGRIFTFLVFWMMRTLKRKLNRRFFTHLIITKQLYYWLSKNSSNKTWSNKFQMVMINYNKLCASL